MYNLILADMYKLHKSMAAKVLFGISLVGAIVMTVMAYLIQNGKLNASSTGIGFMFSDVSIIGILGAVIAGIFICGDFENRTIHDSITNGCSRMDIIGSKVLVFCFSVAVLLLPYAIITGLALTTGAKFSMGAVGVGFLNLLTIEAGKALSASEVVKLLVVMITLIIVYFAQLSICVLLALLLKKPVFVVAIYYAFSILCGRLAGLKDSSKIFNCTPYGGDYSFITLNTTSGEIIKAIFVSLIYIIVILTITYLAFRKSEIK